MGRLSSEAIILRTRPVGEADLIVTFLTESEGKLSGSARNARKSRRRFGGGLEPLARGRATWTESEGAELVRLETFETAVSFAARQRELAWFYLFAYMAEVADTFARDREPDPRFFRLLRAASDASGEGSPPGTVRRWFEIWTLRLQGLLPALEECARCGQGPLEAGIVAAEAGEALCAGCAVAAAPGGGDGAPGRGRARLDPAGPAPARRPARRAGNDGRYRPAREAVVRRIHRPAVPYGAVSRGSTMNLQDLILALQGFWARRGALIQQPYDMEVGAGTMHPDTFFRVLGPEPWSVAFVQPSRRPGDGRYGENPMRVYKHLQMQVILKPAPEDVQDLYLESLTAFGIDPRKHDIRFEEDNWESPTLGAAGVGWQVLMDGMEITQFTYFQQAGGQELSPVSAELTYGLERITMFLTGIRNIFDIPWRDGIPYGEVRRQEEIEHSTYAFEAADATLLFRLFEQYEREGTALLDRDRPLLYPAYDYALRCSHTFNLIDARGAISITERAAYIQRIRALAVRCASRYLELRREAGFPLLPPPEREKFLARAAAAEQGGAA